MDTLFCFIAWLIRLANTSITTLATNPVILSPIPYVPFHIGPLGMRTNESLVGWCSFLVVQFDVSKKSRRPERVRLCDGCSAHSLEQHYHGRRRRSKNEAAVTASAEDNIALAECRGLLRRRQRRMLQTIHTRWCVLTVTHLSFSGIPKPPTTSVIICESVLGHELTTASAKILIEWETAQNSSP